MRVSLEQLAILIIALGLLAVVVGIAMSALGKYM